MDDQKFIAQFQVGTLEPFHHQDHVRMAWLYLQRDSVLIALAKFTDDLQRYALSKGQPNLYHATITWAFLFLIHERMNRAPASGWEEFKANNPDLFAWEQRPLHKYYRDETLASELARRIFIFPDNCEVSSRPA